MQQASKEIFENLSKVLDVSYLESTDLEGQNIILIVKVIKLGPLVMVTTRIYLIL